MIGVDCFFMRAYHIEIRLYRISVKSGESYHKVETIKAVSPTESGTYKSGESYRKWNRFEAALRRSLKFYLKEELYRRFLTKGCHGTEKAGSNFTKMEIKIKVIS